MDDKIIIIEGPPPTFELVSDGWALSLNESPYLYSVGVTRLRTFNSAALLERCHRAWRNHHTINLEYRNLQGLESRAPILAARALEVEEGDLLILWVRLEFSEDDLQDDSDGTEDALGSGDSPEDTPF